MSPSPGLPPGRLDGGLGNRVVCVFAAGGDHFSVVEPKMTKASKAALMDVLREILEDEGAHDS